MFKNARHGPAGFRQELKPHGDVAASSDVDFARFLNRSRRLGLDDVEMDAAASRTAHGPVFGVATGDNAQHDERRAAFRAVGHHLPGRLLLGFCLRHGCRHFQTGQSEIRASAEGIGRAVM